ncbi:hypothetical protein HAX54_049661, partial [Datura stramonium]|nr:hypothetical protein [Datura stramonium]
PLRNSLLVTEHIALARVGAIESESLLDIIDLSVVDSTMLLTSVMGTPLRASLARESQLPDSSPRDSPPRALPKWTAPVKAQSTSLSPPRGPTPPRATRKMPKIERGVDTYEEDL